MITTPSSGDDEAVVEFTNSLEAKLIARLLLYIFMY